MKFEELELSLTKKIANVYIINGGESYLTTTALSIIEKALNLNYPDFNKIIFTDEGYKTAGDIINACQVLPFCDEKRLIVVYDYIGKKNESEKKEFLKYFNNPVDSTCLVFFSTNKSEFFSSLEGKPVVIECEKVSNNFLTKFVTDKLKFSNLELTPEALNKFLDYCNYSITKLNTEIDKLKTLVLSNNIIEEDIIENIVSKDIEYIIFDLTNAISNKQNDKVYLLIDNMIKNKEQPINIIATISSHFRRLFYVSRSDLTNKELSELLGVKEFAIIKYKQQTQNFTQKKLKDIFDKCIEVEFMTKNGKMEGKNAVNYLIANILK